MNITLYLPQKTWVHGLTGPTKLLILLCVFVLALCFSHPLYLLGVFGLVMGMLGLSRVWDNVKKVWGLTALLFCYSVILWPFFVNGHTPVPLLNHIGVTWEGIMVGIGMGLRLLIMLWGGIWLLSTATIEELALASRQLGLPARIGFTFSLAFRWVEMLLGAGIGIIQAQRARGLDLRSGNIPERIRKYVPLVVPLIGHVLRQTQLLAMALESKGFHPSARRRLTSQVIMGGKDYLVLMVWFMALGLSLWMRWHEIGTLDIQF